MKTSMTHLFQLLPVSLFLLNVVECRNIVDADDVYIKNMIRYALDLPARKFRVSTTDSLDDLPINSTILEVSAADNAFTIGQRVCDVMKEKSVLSIFNTHSDMMEGYIKSLAYNLEIPYLKVTHDQFQSYDPDFTINFHPDIDGSIVRLIQYFEWRKAVLIYYGYAGFMRMVTLSKHLVEVGVKVSLHEISNTYEMHRLFKSVKKEGWRNFLIDLPLDKTLDILNVALTEGMIKDSHSFLLINMDIQYLDLTPFQYNHANITTLSYQINSSHTAAILKDMASYSAYTGRSLFIKANSLTASSLLTFDAITSFKTALRDLKYVNDVSDVMVTCDNGNTLEIGQTIFNYISSARWSGLSGQLVFNNGRRTDYSLYVLQLIENHGMTKILEYEIIDGKSQEKLNSIPELQGRANRSLIVTVVLTINTQLSIHSKEIICENSHQRHETPVWSITASYAAKEEPFVVLAPNHEDLSGNDKYIGFCVDMIELIATELGFTYEIQLCVNCTYGAPDENGQWGGMVEKIIKKQADLALGSFTINYQREQVIDMTKPFMHVGISILYKAPNKRTPGLFSFMEPLATETWFFLILAYFVVSLCLYMLGRLSPYEHVSQAVINSSSGTEIIVKNYRLTLANSLWFTVGTLMQQGSDVSPTAASTRIIGGFWWLFSLLVISTYTANLAAFLTVERMVTPIENADDLSMQTQIQYGSLASGSTWLFFKESKIETFKRMWTYMSARPEVFVDSYEQGIERAKAGGYALLMESAGLDYIVQRNCDLMQVGGLLDSKGYGVGTQLGSPWRDLISHAILKLQEGGKIQEIYDRWWKKPGICSKNHGKAESSANALDMENVGGMFIILISGLFFGGLIAAVEYVHTKRKQKKSPVDKVKTKGLEVPTIAQTTEDKIGSFNRMTKLVPLIAEEKQVEINSNPRREKPNIVTSENSHPNGGLQSFRLSRHESIEDSPRMRSYHSSRNSRPIYANNDTNATDEGINA